MKITEGIYRTDIEIKQAKNIVPISQDFLTVTTLHKLWYAEYGNKEGVPVIVVHGGPGGGCSEETVSNFDLNFYRVILLDQRGSGKSVPHAEIEGNTTPELIEDLEKLRIHLSIEQWILYGGSWGTALSLLYGEKYPQNCLGFILRGVFLATEKEKWQVWYGLRDTYPEHWDKMTSFIPKDQKDNLEKVFFDLTTTEDKATQVEAAKALLEYDLKASSVFDIDVSVAINDEELVLAVARFFSYYSINNFFIGENQIINNISNVNHLPLIIVHGRRDDICKPIAAYNLHMSWPGSRLYMVQDGGHSENDPAILLALLGAIEEMKEMVHS